MLARLERIAVFRALRLGDMLCAVPALRSLRHGFPRARITLIGLPWARAFVDRFRAYVDDFIAFPGWPGLPEQSVDPPTVVHFLSQAQQLQFDLAVQLHGSGVVTNPLVALFGAPRLAGFHAEGAWAPDAETFVPYPSDRPEVLRLLALPQHLGLPVSPHLEFPLDAADCSAAPAIDGEYVCVNGGASSPAKCWTPEGFAALADALAGQGLRVVLTGSATDAPMVERVARAMRAPAINVAPLNLPLGALAALLSRARMVVTNDTGVSHLAVALQKPCLIIFTTADPHRWAPLDLQRHRVLINPPVQRALEEVCKSTF